MSNTASCLKVAEFFQLCNWQMLPQAKPNLQREQIPENTRLQQVQSVASSCLSVKEFFNLCNWQLLPQAKPNLQHVDQISSASLQQISPSCLSVKDFFNLCNWQLIPLDHCYLPPQVEQTLNLNALPVQEFFQFIPWDGSPEIASLPQQAVMLEPIVQEKAPTLNDLSNLF